MTRSGGGVPGPPRIPPELLGLPVWLGNLRVGEKGTALRITPNGRVALEQDPAFTMATRLDAF